MSSRGLPGFLRRSRRWNDFEDEDDDAADNEADNDNKGDEKEDLDQDANQRQCQELSGSNEPSHLLNASLQFLQPSAPTGPSTGDIAPSNNNSISSSSKDHPNEDQTPADDITDKQTDDQSLSTIGDYDPTTGENLSFRSMTAPPSTSVGRSSSKVGYRELQFEKLLSHNVVKLSELRKIGWNGIPCQYRGMVWKILLGYLPANASRRQQTLERKRAEYKEAIRQHYDIDDDSRTLQEQETLRQVLVDVPRTAPDVPLFRNEKIKRSLARLLYTWAMRHPASSYVQGINDLATPLFAVFLADDYEGEDVQDGSVMVVLSEERLDEVEADVYWCLTNILAGIQDHYTADQPGVQRMVMRLQELVNRIDGGLCDHIDSVGIQFMQFAFKWMNCLLLREFNLQCVIRLWDTYISEENGNGFEDFHIYVCAAFLCQFSSQLQEMQFDELFQFMQAVPTEDWGETEIEMLLSQAYVLSTLFGGSDAHLTSHGRQPLGPLM
ncbi:Rab-GTPase-TBC domain containing protein [Nitzschia inconspicua]|uniref:Rab-GTPase-TBC domain containing protein n=1 Tax=Nitzschia inconspicua TaxID=303405 RepID=A0A9K3PQR4_9STRA|nr:Rab-GTPase-TBC domain containing protein [Nitzschia inconspicua]KAG7356515.1 Rab-GTPase-TBC domain containing protein [Nitzschia inconspicua]